MAKPQIITDIETTKTQLASKPNEISGLDGTIDLTGGQIKFPTTQYSSSDPNTMDDYEEGTFTPYIYGVPTAGTATYTRKTGKYCKIGNMVHVIIDLLWTGHTGAGEMKIGGLPFMAAALTGLSIGLSSQITTRANTVLIALAEGLAPIVNLSEMQVGGATYQAAAMDSAGWVIVSGTYIV